MYRITIIKRSERKNFKLRFRLRDTHSVDIYHKTQISVSSEDLTKFNSDGSIKKGVSVYNKELFQLIQDEIGNIKSAYQSMINEGLDITSKNLERKIDKIKNPEKPSSEEDCLLRSLLEYTETRKNRFSNIRYRQFIVLHKQLERYLVINNKKKTLPQHFTPKDILFFREFLFDEYKYVDKWPNLYEDVSDRNIPKKRRSETTVASSLKRLKTYFQQLEDEDIIAKSPFRKMSRGDKRNLFKEQEGAKTGLEQDEIKTIENTPVPSHLQEVKDAFLLNCYIGCRVSDFANMSMDRVVKTKDGYPYIHYLPNKEKSINKSVDAPLIPPAMKIIDDYKFSFKILKNKSGKDGYNQRIKELLKYCGIDRKVDDHLSGKFTPLHEIASSKTARKTYLTLQVEHQPDPYLLGVHKQGSIAVNNYLTNSMAFKYMIVCRMFGVEDTLVEAVHESA